MEQNLKKQEQIRKQLIGALLEFADTKPARLIAVRDICETSGLHRSTFYRYLETLEVMIRALEAEYLAGLEEVYLRMDFSNGLTKSSKAGLFDMIQFYAHNKRLSGFLIFQSGDSAFYDRYVALVRRYYILNLD